jgi:hypothetical protein
MARLDVFVCDRCRKQVINTSAEFGSSAGDWQNMSFMMATNNTTASRTPHKPLLLCPGCVTSVCEPLAQESERVRQG